MLNVGWLSASPVATTGYGIQTKEITSRILSSGRHNIKCIGGTGGTIIWGGHTFLPVKKQGVEIEILPTLGDMTGKDVLPGYIKKHNLDVIISLWDCYVVSWLQDIKIPACMYIPIDAPFTKQMYDYVRGAYFVIAYSKFGYNELLKWMAPSKVRYIPHGIDTEEMKPASENEKKEMRETINVPEDAFLVIDAGANIGERKHIPLLMKVFSDFAKKHDDAYLYLFSNSLTQFPQGYNLMAFAENFGIKDRVRVPEMDPIIAPWSNTDLAKLYSCADVMATTTVGEGFGIPVAEAQACGTPVIATECSSMTELVSGHGWLVETVPEDRYVFTPVWLPTCQMYPVPDMREFYKCLSIAYHDRNLLKEFGRKSREFMLQYDWSKVMPMWYELLDEIESDFQLLHSTSN